MALFTSFMSSLALTSKLISGASVVSPRRMNAASGVFLKMRIFRGADIFHYFVVFPVRMFARFGHVDIFEYEGALREL